MAQADDRGDARGFRPGGRVGGDLAVPGSKSIAQRALVAAGLAAGRTRLVGLPNGDDVLAMREALARSGVGLVDVASAPGRPRHLEVEGRPPGTEPGWRPRGGLLDPRESGTGARLLTAALACCGPVGEEVRVVARGSLLSRSSAALFSALEAAGVSVVHDGATPGGWPVRLVPVVPPPLLVLRAATSSQEVTALLLASSAHSGEHVLRVEGTVPSRPYVELTCAVLAEFGVSVESAEQGGAEELSLCGPLVAPTSPLRIEPDASSAAVALAAACISGGALRVPDLSERSAQGDVRIVEHLRAFGCEAAIADRALEARGSPCHGAQLDLSGQPDLAPVLAAVAAAAALAGGGPSQLTGLETLPGKESSRIEVLARGLRAAGLDARATRCALVVAAPSTGAGPDIRREVVLDSAGDHRMAFAFALLSLARDGVRVAGPACVTKSWPGFWEDLERVGARRA